MKGKFLVTGLPRTRTAWLSALFSGASVTCYHDALVMLGGIKNFKQATFGFTGLFDPAAACVYPEDSLKEFALCQIVVVVRDEFHSKAALEKTSIPYDWESISKNYYSFCSVARALHVPYHSLDDYNTVNAVHHYCTGLELPFERFKLFSMLKIEQHSEKAFESISK